MAQDLNLQLPHFNRPTHILGCVAHVINIGAKFGVEALGLIGNNQEREEISMSKNNDVPNIRA